MQYYVQADSNRLIRLDEHDDPTHSSTIWYDTYQRVRYRNKDTPTLMDCYIDVKTKARYQSQKKNYNNEKRIKKTNSK